MKKEHYIPLTVFALSMAILWFFKSQGDNKKKKEVKTEDGKPSTIKKDSISSIFTKLILPSFTFALLVWVYLSRTGGGEEQVMHGDYFDTTPA